MPAVIIFHEYFEEADGRRRRIVPVDNTTEVHVFEDDVEAIRYSTANRDRPHTIRKIDGERWHVSSAPRTAEKGGDS